MRFNETRKQLLHAREEADIIRLLQRAIAELTPAELAVLPPECRHIREGETLHDMAIRCLHHDLRLRGDAEVGELVRQVAELYAAASVRLSHLHHQAS